MKLNLKDKSTWDPLMDEALRDILGNSYTETLIVNADKIEYRDCEEGACALFSKKITRNEIINIIIDKIKEYYQEVITYHACRPLSLSDYYLMGIIPLTPSKAQLQFRKMFNPYATDEQIQKSISSVSTNTRAGMVYSALDDRIFQKRSGHYLIYGSEYIHCLAISLPGFNPERTREILKSYGKATVFECKLPFSMVCDLSYLASFMLADHFFRLAHGIEEVLPLDYTVFSYSKILPDQVLDHYHPTKIIDPFKGRAVWNDEILQYE